MPECWDDMAQCELLEEMFCCDWKEHRQKSLQIELVAKYDTKDT